MITSADEARFASKYEPQSNGCLQWTGPLDKDGYGTFALKGRGRRAHRVAWVFARGPIPEGMVVNHKCGNRACVNHQHLELLTPRENSLQDSRSLPALNARKTHCANGHLFDKVERKAGGREERYCSICRKAKANARRRQRGDPLKELFGWHGKS